MKGCSCNNNCLGFSNGNQNSGCGCDNNVCGTNTSPLVITSPTACNPNKSAQEKLCDLLGRTCTCVFVIGDNGTTIERRGILAEVGDDYIALRSLNSGNCTICSLCNLQFLTVN